MFSFALPTSLRLLERLHGCSKAPVIVVSRKEDAHGNICGPDYLLHGNAWNGLRQELSVVAVWANPAATEQLSGGILQVVYALFTQDSGFCDFVRQHFEALETHGGAVPVSTLHRLAPNATCCVLRPWSPRAAAPAFEVFATACVLEPDSFAGDNPEPACNAEDGEQCPPGCCPFPFSRPPSKNAQAQVRERRYSPNALLSPASAAAFAAADDGDLSGNPDWGQPPHSVAGGTGLWPRPRRPVAAILLQFHVADSKPGTGAAAGGTNGGAAAPSPVPGAGTGLPPTLPPEALTEDSPATPSALSDPLGAAPASCRRPPSAAASAGVGAVGDAVGTAAGPAGKRTATAAAPMNNTVVAADADRLLIALRAGGGSGGGIHRGAAGSRGAKGARGAVADTTSASAAAAACCPPAVAAAQPVSGRGGGGAGGCWWQRSCYVLSALPMCVTIFNRGGSVLFQNAASIDYFGARSAAAPQSELLGPAAAAAAAAVGSAGTLTSAGQWGVGGGGAAAAVSSGRGHGSGTPTRVVTSKGFLGRLLVQLGSGARRRKAAARGGGGGGIGIGGGSGTGRGPEGAVLAEDRQAVASAWARAEAERRLLLLQLQPQERPLAAAVAASAGLGAGTGSGSCGGGGGGASVLLALFAFERPKLGELWAATAAEGGMWQGMVRVPRTLNPDPASSSTASGVTRVSGACQRAAADAVSGDGGSDDGKGSSAASVAALRQQLYDMAAAVGPTVGPQSSLSPGRPPAKTPARSAAARRARPSPPPSPSVVGPGPSLPLESPSRERVGSDPAIAAVPTEGPSAPLNSRNRSGFTSLLTSASFGAGASSERSLPGRRAALPPPPPQQQQQLSCPTPDQGTGSGGIVAPGGGDGDDVGDITLPAYFCRSPAPVTSPAPGSPRAAEGAPLPRGGAPAAAATPARVPVRGFTAGMFGSFSAVARRLGRDCSGTDFSAAAGASVQLSYASFCSAAGVSTSRGPRGGGVVRTAAAGVEVPATGSTVIVDMGEEAAAVWAGSGGGGGAVAATTAAATTAAVAGEAACEPSGSQARRRPRSASQRRWASLNPLSTSTWQVAFGSGGVAATATAGRISPPPAWGRLMVNALTDTRRLGDSAAAPAAAQLDPANSAARDGGNGGDPAPPPVGVAAAALAFRTASDPDGLLATAPTGGSCLAVDQPNLLAAEALSYTAAASVATGRWRRSLSAGRPPERPAGAAPPHLVVQRSVGPSRPLGLSLHEPRRPMGLKSDDAVTDKLLALPGDLHARLVAGGSSGPDRLGRDGGIGGSSSQVTWSSGAHAAPSLPAAGTKATARGRLLLAYQSGSSDASRLSHRHSIESSLAAALASNISTPDRSRPGTSVPYSIPPSSRGLGDGAGGGCVASPGSAAATRPPSRVVAFAASLRNAPTLPRKSSASSAEAISAGVGSTARRRSERRALAASALSHVPFTKPGPLRSPPRRLVASVGSGMSSGLLAAHLSAYSNGGCGGGFGEDGGGGWAGGGATAEDVVGVGDRGGGSALRAATAAATAVLKAGQQVSRLRAADATAPADAVFVDAAADDDDNAAAAAGPPPGRSWTGGGGDDDDGRFRAEISAAGALVGEASAASAAGAGPPGTPFARGCAGAAVAAATADSAAERRSPVSAILRHIWSARVPRGQGGHIGGLRREVVEEREAYVSGGAAAEAADAAAAVAAGAVTDAAAAAATAAAYGDTAADSGSPPSGGGDAGCSSSSSSSSCEVWHEVLAVGLSDPVSGGRVVLVMQRDVTAKVVAERHVAQVSETEHRLLEQIFPRHVLQYIMEEAGLGSKSARGDIAGPHGSVDPGAGRDAGGGGGGSLAAAEAAVDARWRPHIRDCNRLAVWHPRVTVLFADIQGFTPMCKVLPPGVVMTFLNTLFTAFDAMLDRYGVYKVETIGDCYMVAGGLIREDEDGMAAVQRAGQVDPRQAASVVGFAKAMLRAAACVRLPTSGQPVRVRVGIHSGPVVSGVVGTRMPRFCLFGDTVNTASRMESSGVPGSIHVSQDTYDMLRWQVPGAAAEEGWEPTGGVEVKGKGLMRTHLWTPNPQPHTLQSPITAAAAAGPAPTSPPAAAATTTTTTTAPVVTTTMASQPSAGPLQRAPHRQGLEPATWEALPGAMAARAATQHQPPRLLAVPRNGAAAAHGDGGFGGSAAVAGGLPPDTTRIASPGAAIPFALISAPAAAVAAGAGFLQPAAVPLASHPPVLGRAWKLLSGSVKEPRDGGRTAVGGGGDGGSNDNISSVGCGSGCGGLADYRLSPIPLAAVRAAAAQADDGHGAAAAAPTEPAVAGGGAGSSGPGGVLVVAAGAP